jgi:hypothetical protein
MSPAPIPIEHGTERGYQAHWRRGQKACDDCRAAHNAHTTAQYHAKRDPNTPPPGRHPRPIPPCGTIAAYSRHRRRGEPPCDPCRKANSETSLRNRRRAQKRLEEQIAAEGLGRRIQLPIKVFAELYWTASKQALLMLDDLFTSETVDEMIKEAEEL